MELTILTKHKYKIVMIGSSKQGSTNTFEVTQQDSTIEQKKKTTTQHGIDTTIKIIYNTHTWEINWKKINALNTTK